SCHPDNIGVNSEMHDCPTLELEDALTWISVSLVLVLCMFGCLPGQWILEFRSRYGNTVQCERHINRILVLGAVMHLPRDGEPVRLIQPLRIGIHPVRRSKIGHSDELSEAFESVSDGCQCSSLAVEGLGQVIEDDCLRLSAV